MFQIVCTFAMWLDFSHLLKFLFAWPWKECLDSQHMAARRRAWHLDFSLWMFSSEISWPEHKRTRSKVPSVLPLLRHPLTGMSVIQLALKNITKYTCIWMILNAAIKSGCMVFQPWAWHQSRSKLCSAMWGPAATNTSANKLTNLIEFNSDYRSQ